MDVDIGKSFSTPPDSLALGDEVSSPPCLMTGLTHGYSPLSDGCG